MSGPRAASRRSRRRRTEASLRRRATVDRDQWRRALARHECKSVFHVTPITNLRSILLHGLLPRDELRNRAIGVEPHSPGHDPHAASRFESCCVFSLVQPHWRLLQRSEVPYVGLVLPAEAVLTPGTRFVLNKIELDSERAGYSHRAFESLWRHARSKHLAGEVEVWVPGTIRPELITEIRVTASMMPAAQNVLRTHPPSSQQPRVVKVGPLLS